MKSIVDIKIPSKDGKKYKEINFYNEDKYNYTQIKYFNEIFNPDLSFKTDSNEVAYWGAFRCGKSFSQQLAVFLLCLKYPKISVIYIRDTYNQLEDSVIKQFNDEFEWLGHYVYKSSNRTCFFNNGSQLRFRTFERDTGILSTQYDVIAICQSEDINQELFLQLYGRLSGTILPHPVLLTEGNPTSGFYKDRYKDSTIDSQEEKDIYFLEGKTSDNPFIPKGYIDTLRKNYPEFWIARYVDGEWNNLDEMVFSEFREHKHIIEPIDFEFVKNYKRRLGFDWGWRTSCALVWGYIDYDNNLTIFDEWGDPQKTPQEIFDASRKYGRDLVVADYSIKAPNSAGRSLWEDFQKLGMPLLESNKQEKQNILLFNTLLKQGRIKITRNCVNLIREIKNYKWKLSKLGSDKEVSEEPIQKDNHYIDAVLYLLASLEEVRQVSPEQKAYKKTLEYAVITGTRRLSRQDMS